jgi:hypothetical protein
MIIDTGKEIINNNMENHNQVQESKMLRLVWHVNKPFQW